MMRPVRIKEQEHKPKVKKGHKATQSNRGGKAGWWGNQKSWVRTLIVVLLIIGLTLGVLGALIWSGVIKLSIAPGTPTPAGYGVTISDGALNVELDGTSFDYDLYGTNESTWSDFDLLQTGTDITDISAADMLNPSNDNTYTTFWVRYNGTQLHDDDIYGAAHDRGARTYGERWASLDPTTANDLVAYETPNVVVMYAFDSDTMALLTTPFTAQVPVGTNITIIVGTNASQPEAMYVPYYDPSIDDTIQMHISAVFNDTIVRGDFEIASTSGTVAIDTIVYDLGSIMPGTTILAGKWSGPTITGLAALLDSLELLWGTTTLDTI